MTLKLTRNNGHWYVTGTLVGQRVRQSTRLPDTPSYRAMAEKERLKIEQEIINGSFGHQVVRTTFQEACDAYVSWQRVEGKSVIDQQRKLDKLCEQWGNVRLTDITNQAIQVYVKNEWGHLAPNSIKRYLNDFRAVLNHARKSIQGFNGVDIPMPRVKDARDIHFDEAQANAYLEWVQENHPYYYPHYLTLIDTGVRLNEMLGLRSTAFNTDVVRVRRRLVRSGKTQSRDIPLTADMKSLATRFRRLKATDTLYTTSKGLPFSSADSASATLCGVLKEGCEAMGLPHTGKEAMRVHDLRHTFAYLTARNGCDLGDLQYLLGHEDIGQTMRYRGFIQSRARTFVGSLRGQ